MAQKIRILIVDDHVLLRDGLIRLFEPQPDFEVVGDVGTVHDAIAKAVELKPDLVLMDIKLPDGDGVEATRVILAKLPKTKVVILTMHESDELLFEALRGGAKGYLLKNTPATKLVAALRALEQGEAPLSRSMTSRLIDDFARMGKIHQAESDGLDLLTPRELEVLKHLATEASNREIAEKLFISENTVKHHVHSILKKLKFRNRREVANFANRQEIVSSPNGKNDRSNSNSQEG